MLGLARERRTNTAHSFIDPSATMSFSIGIDLHSCCVPSPIKALPHGASNADNVEEEHLQAKIGRAMRAGPYQVTKDATIADWSHDGSIKVLRAGTNDWVCFPGNENEIGNVPMAADPMGLQWLKDIILRKPAPTNTVRPKWTSAKNVCELADPPSQAPGLVYMLCGAFQHSNDTPFDYTSEPIPIGPHYMITWPFHSKTHGFPTNVRDAGAWVMFDNTPYAYLHICGTPWTGVAYHPESHKEAVWTMQYLPPYQTEL